MCLSSQLLALVQSGIILLFLCHTIYGIIYHVLTASAVSTHTNHTILIYNAANMSCNQWCSQGQNLKAKAKAKASTLKAKAKAWTFEAKAKAKAWTFEAKAIGPSAKAFNHIRPQSRSGTYAVGLHLTANQDRQWTKFHCFCLAIHSFIHSNL